MLIYESNRYTVYAQDGKFRVTSPKGSCVIFPKITLLDTFNLGFISKTGNTVYINTRFEEDFSLYAFKESDVEGRVIAETVNGPNTGAV